MAYNQGYPQNGYGAGGYGQYGGQYGGGYGGGQPPRPPSGYPPMTPRFARQPPPGADRRLWEYFQAVDTDGSGTLTVDELQRALINADWTTFNMETVRMMVNMFDTDNSGTISFEEFTGLWRYIEDWQKCFRAFDRDNSGNIDANELKLALRTFGYNLTDRFIHILIQKFDRYGHGNITFDNFVQVCATIRTLTLSFQSLDRTGTGVIQIGYEQFLELVIQQRS